MNSLYVYDKKSDDCPGQFWLLSSVKELTQLDSDDREFLLELAFDAEIVIFKFDNQENLDSWQAMLEKAKDFNASKYYTGETVTEIKELILAHDTTTLLTFNMNHKSQITNQGFLLMENIIDVVIKELKPECSLVISVKIIITSDYASPGFAGLRYMAPWTDWCFLPFWRFFWPILILGQFVIIPYSNIF